MRRTLAFRLLAWLVATALLLQSWIGQLATAAVSAEFEAVVICTGSGFKVISLPVDPGQSSNPSGTEDDHRPPDLDCMACLVKAAVQATAAPAPDGVTRVYRERAKARVPEPLLPASIRHHAHRSRAPPAAA